jgi:hypothetical protein
MSADDRNIAVVEMTHHQDCAAQREMIRRSQYQISYMSHNVRQILGDIAFEKYRSACSSRASYPLCGSRSERVVNDVWLPPGLIELLIGHHIGARSYQACSVEGSRGVARGFPNLLLRVTGAQLYCSSPRRI